jgi:hypothetical protein
LLNGFEKASASAYNVNEVITNKFDLTHKMSDVLRKLEQSSFGAIKMLDQNLLKIWGSYITLISRETIFRHNTSTGGIKVLVDSAVAERNNAVAERDHILNSTIWKLFAPYRKTKNFFRKR